MPPLRLARLRLSAVVGMAGIRRGGLSRCETAVSFPIFRFRFGLS